MQIFLGKYKKRKNEARDIYSFNYGFHSKILKLFHCSIVEKGLNVCDETTKN